MFAASFHPLRWGGPDLLLEVDLIPSGSPNFTRPGGGKEAARREVQRDLEVTSRKTGIEPEELLRRASSGQSFVRHARAGDAIFAAQDRGITATPEQVQELHEARTAFDEHRPHGSRDAEAVYKRNPGFAADCAGPPICARIGSWNAFRN